MAELEVRSKTDPNRTWRRPLPAGPALIGREGAELWGSAPWDKQISRVHATLHYKDGRLLIRRRTVPRPTTNPIFFNGKETDDFTIGPGEHFVIGDTTFTLLDVTLTPAPSFPKPTELTIGEADLRQLPFDNP